MSDISCPKCNTYPTESIFDNIEIINHFQPIISTLNSNLTGFESLCRGICKQCGKLIPPLELFDLIEDDNDLLKVDLIARKQALEIFGKLSAQNSGLLLFFNFDAKLIEKLVENSYTLFEMCRENNVHPENVVIEITESKPCNIDILENFVKKCRESGFLIALDDVGTGYSNFDRISTIKPDIIKIDRSIINNLDKDYYKKVIFRSLSRLSSKIGTLLLAEGVETENELIYAIELGADFIQGFYFSRPENITEELLFSLGSKISYMSDLYKDYKIKKIETLKKNYQIYDVTILELSNILKEKKEEDFDSFLESQIEKFSFIESIYILNDAGYQITDSHMNCSFCRMKPKIFKTVRKGDSHYYKDYFYLLQVGPFNKFTTDVHLSPITGDLCRTISIKFDSLDNKSYILCMNVIEN